MAESRHPVEQNAEQKRNFQIRMVVNMSTCLTLDPDTIRLQCELIDTLMKAVDKFDFDRGFRFSTYAYRSITRRAYRQISSRQESARRFTHTVEEAATCQPEDSNGRSASPAAWTQLREMLGKMLSCLDRRERFIIRRRYGMGRSQKAATFQSMANKLGVSKERVRQLESRAVGKLKSMGEELGMSDLFEQNEATSLN